MAGAQRPIVATILWIATVAMFVVAVADERDPCQPSDWTQLAALAVPFVAAGATFASLPRRPSSLYASVAVVILVGGVVWFIRMAHWAGGCTA